MATKKAGESGLQKHDPSGCARLLRAIAYPERLLILQALAERSQCVKDLNAVLPIAQSRLSQHMTALRKAELVDCHSSGPLRCYYILRPALIRGMVRLLCQPHEPRERSRESVLSELRRYERRRAAKTTMVGKH